LKIWHSKIGHLKIGRNGENVVHCAEANGEV